jgi:predicted Zn-dependent peptidase
MACKGGKQTSRRHSIQTHTFQNGLRLIYERHPENNPQTHIRAFCHFGSINEPDHLRGAAHFIEHMCFKGSRTFPSWSEVNEPFSHSGATFNAFTTKQYTCFEVDCLNSYVKPFAKIIGDIMLHSTFDRKEYNLELNVVREEMKMKPPNSFLEELAFSKTVYAHPVDNVSYHKPGDLPYDEVVSLYQQYYTPNNMVLSIVSSIQFSTILQYISNTPFAEQLHKIKSIPPILNPNLGTLLSFTDPTSTAKTTNFIVKSSPSGGDTATIEIGVRVCNQFQDNEVYALNILRQIISNSTSSRLFVELREKCGLTYRSGAYMNLYEPAGIFVLYAISDVNRLIHDDKSSRPGVIPVIFNIIEDLIANGITEREWKTAKHSIRESLKMESMAGGDKTAYNGIRVMLHNETDEDIRSNSELFDKCYKPITKSDVNAVIQKYFAERMFFVSVFGGKIPKPHSIINFLRLWTS